MKNSLFQKPVFWVCIIFAAAAIFRIFSLDLIEFKYDEAFTVFQMEQFFAHPYLMQVGPPQSTGVYNPPLFNYLMVIMSLFSRDPQYLSFVIALLNSIFIVIFYLLVRKPFGNSAAIFSSLLLALSPWSIIFSRKIWIPDLILPFMVCFLYFYLKRSFLPLFVILALLIQMHASGLFFAIATILLFILAREKFNPKQAFLGFMIGLIPAVPYLIRQLASTPFCIDCVSFLDYEALPKSFDPAVFIRPFQLLWGLNFEVLLGQDFAQFMQTFPYPSLVYYPFWLGMFLPIAGSVWLIIQKKYRVLAFYPFLIPLLYFLAKTPSFMHYFAILLPIAALLSGLAFKFAWDKLRDNALRVVLLSLTFVFLLSNLVFVTSFYRFLSAKQVIAGDYGPVFPKTREFVEKETLDYRLFPEYPLIKSYAYMFAKPEIIHARLGELFAQGNPQLATIEFEKALQQNQRDKISRMNLIYSLAVLGEKDKSKKELEILSSQDSTAAAELKNILQQKLNLLF